MSIAIINYGLANLRSVQKAFEHVGHPAQIITDPADVARFDRLVLPGVGAIADAVAGVREQGFEAPIRRHVEAGRPLLGICLGLQMLFDVSHEDGQHPCLGILPGEVVRFDVDATQRLKVPHMGWNQLQFTQDSPLHQGLEDGCNVYFVHSYHVKPADPAHAAMLCDYGGDFVAGVRHENVYACQFHPEKSQAVGLRMIENFATRT